MNDEPNRRDLDRLIFFSDGVFAIAITLLALELRLPGLPEPVTAAALGDALLDQMPKFVSFVISFEVIGIFWLAHHRMFGDIARYDGRLAVLNLFFLMAIVVLPFSSSLLGEYASLAPAAVFYAGNLVVASLAWNVVWWHASSDRRLIDPGLTPIDARVASARGLVTLALFTASVGAALVRPAATQGLWVLVILAGPSTERVIRRRARKA